MTLTESELNETRELIARARKLSPAAREKLVQELCDDVDGPENDPEAIKQAWREEIRRRIEAIQNGTMKMYTIEETMAYLQTVVDETEQR